jgi:hypothetical protein
MQPTYVLQRTWVVGLCPEPSCRSSGPPGSWERIPCRGGVRTEFSISRASATLAPGRDSDAAVSDGPRGRFYESPFWPVTFRTNFYRVWWIKMLPKIDEFLKYSNSQYYWIYVHFKAIKSNITKKWKIMWSFIRKLRPKLFRKIDYGVMLSYFFPTQKQP